MANNSLVDLFVAGARTVITVAHSRVKGRHNTLDRQQVKAEGKRSRSNIKEKNEKDKIVERRLSDSRIAPQSSSSSKSLASTNQPVIWVNIAKKMTAVPIMFDILNRESAVAPRILSVADTAKQEKQLDAFDAFLQQNFRLMAEIRTAKRRRLHNRQISRALDNEDNINWTSNAPRPSQNLALPNRQSHRRKARKKRKRKIKNGGERPESQQQLPKSIEGVNCVIAGTRNWDISSVRVRSKTNRDRKLKCRPTVPSNVIDKVVESFPFQLQDTKSKSSVLSNQTRNKVKHIYF